MANRRNVGRDEVVLLSKTMGISQVVMIDL